MARSQWSLGQLCLVIAWLAPPLALFAVFAREYADRAIPFAILFLWLSPVYVALGIQLIAKASFWREWIVQLLILLPFVLLLFVLELAICGFLLVLVSVAVSDVSMFFESGKLIAIPMMAMCAMTLFLGIGYGLLAILRPLALRRCPVCSVRRVVLDLTGKARPMGRARSVHTCLRCGGHFALRLSYGERRMILDPINSDGIRWLDN
jgi:hypothetical protein